MLHHPSITAQAVVVLVNRSFVFKEKLHLKPTSQTQTNYFAKQSCFVLCILREVDPQ